MSIALTSIGVKISRAVESTAGVRPTTGYKIIKDLKSCPDFNIAPSTFDITTFENVEYTTKGELLKELPDTLEFDSVFSQDFYDTWIQVISEFDTAVMDGKKQWFCIDIPGLSASIYFFGKPVRFGMPGFESNAGIDATVRIIPMGEPIFAEDPTYESDEDGGEEENGI